MFFPVNLKSGSKQRLFIDHFNAALRRAPKGMSAFRDLGDDGTVISDVTMSIEVDGERIPTTWSYRTDQTGHLDGFNVSAPDEWESRDSWVASVNTMARDILAAAFADEREEFFQRVPIYYRGSALDGEYWLPGFRLAPAVPHDEMPALMNVERIVYIDQNMSAIDKPHATELAMETALRACARLSLLLDVPFFSIPRTRVWVFERGDDKRFRSFRAWSGHTGPTVVPKDMPQKGFEVSLGEYAGSIGAPEVGPGLKVPKDVEPVLVRADDAHPSTRERFDACARLYQVAAHLRPWYPTVALAYRVAAVDALAQGDPELGRFGRVVEKYTESQDDLKEILTFLYRTVRSANFHGGSFALGEFDAPVSGMMTYPERIRVSESQGRGERLLRRTIIAWIYDQLLDRDA